MPNMSLLKNNNTSLLNHVSTNSTILSWTEAALKKANSAALYDKKGSSRLALDAYNEAIVLLNNVIESKGESYDLTRLKMIYSSYVERVSALTHALDTACSKNNHATKPPQRPLPPPPSTDTNHYDTSPSKPSKKHLKSPTIPTPSKSTPSSSTNNPFSSWKKQGSKKKHPGSSDLDCFKAVSPPFSSDKPELESLTLPNMESPKDDDYFDLESTMETRHMLYSKPAYMLKSMYDLHQSDDIDEDEESDIKENSTYYSHNTIDRTNITRSTSASLILSLSPSTSTSSGYTKHQPQLTSSASSIRTCSSSFPSIYSPTQSIFHSNTLAVVGDEEDYSMLPDKISHLIPQTIPKSNSGSGFDDSTIMPELSPVTKETLVPSITTVMAPDSLPATEENTPDTQHLYASQQNAPLSLSRSTSSKSLSSTISQESLRCSNRKIKQDVLAAPVTSNSNTKSRNFWPRRSKSFRASKQPHSITLPAIRADHPSLSKLLSPDWIPGVTDSLLGDDTPPQIKSKGVDIIAVMTAKTIHTSDKQTNLMARLLQSMTEGGYITDRIHAPRQLWYQTHIRLPAIETKVSSCEQVMAVLGRMHDITRLFNQHHLDQHDITQEALYLLDKLDRLLDHINHTCSKSSQEILTATKPDHTRFHSFKDPLNAWSNKLSKSVDRMKIEVKPSGQHMETYIATLVRLFTKAHILDEWRMKFLMGTASMYHTLLQKTQHCHEMLHSVVCGFVMQDLGLLLNKWLKKSRECLLEE